MPTVRVWVDATQEKKLKELEFLEDYGSLKGVVVHDVGQGNGNALVSVTNDEPVLYFDTGCGAIFNAHTCPNDLKYDFNGQPWIILSHWDFDHWWAGYNQKWAEASACEWLAPRQKISAIHQSVAADLDDHLRLWPNKDATYFRRSITATSGDDEVIITRCDGHPEEDRNDSGLAITIRKAQFDDDNALIDPDLVLLPGDAPYDRIPGLDPDADWIGLVATHHGSKTNLLNGNDPIDEVPRACVGDCPVIVYSAGPANYYGHPNVLAVQAYGQKSWQTNPADDTDADGEYCCRYDTFDGPKHRGDRWIGFDYETG